MPIAIELAEAWVTLRNAGAGLCRRYRYDAPDANSLGDAIQLLASCRRKLSVELFEEIGPEAALDAVAYVREMRKITPSSLEVEDSLDAQ